MVARCWYAKCSAWVRSLARPLLVTVVRVRDASIITAAKHLKATLIFTFFCKTKILFGFLLVCLKISLFQVMKTFTRGGIGCDWARWVLLLLRAESTKEPSQAWPAYLWEVASLGFVGYVKFIWSCNSLTFWKSWLFSLAWQNFILSRWISAYWKVPAVWMWVYVWFGD